MVRLLPGLFVLAACGFNTSGVGSGGADGVGSQSSSSTGPSPTTTGLLDSDTGSDDGSSSTTEPGLDTGASSTDADVTSADSGETTGDDPCSICDANAICTVDDGVADCTCPVDFEGDGTACAPVPTLAQLRVELACGLDLGDTCGVGLDDQATAEMIGAPGVVYDVALRIRGITEIKDYAGAAVPDGYWLEDGALGFDGDGTVTLTISDPAATYRLNAATSAGPPVLIDYPRSIAIAGGATVTLVLSSVDFFQFENPGLIIPDVPPEQPFDGQLVQIDVEMITAR